MFVAELRLSRSHDCGKRQLGRADNTCSLGDLLAARFIPARLASGVQATLSRLGHPAVGWLPLGALRGDHRRRTPDLRAVELSGRGGTLPGMAKPPGEWIVPPWVVPPEEQVAALGSVAYSLAVDAKSWHGAGQFGAVRWVASGMTAPVSRRWAPASWTMMRAESWVALCQAAFDDGAPTDREWQRLGVEACPIPYGGAHADDFAHGAWRTLAWLLGVLPEPPVAQPGH